MNETTITILGTGYVGLTTAALFANAGIRTFLVDVNESRLEAVRAGRSFFYEEGLDPLIAQSVTAKMLIPTSSYAECVPQSDIVISAVGTPNNPDGSSNLSYIFAAAKEAAQYCRPGTIYVQKSTVPVGTGEQVMEVFAQANAEIVYLSNPEFLRESTAVVDSLWPDRVVIGGSNTQSMQKLHDIYRQVEAQREHIAQVAGIAPPKQLPVARAISTTLPSAELIKVTANAFLALKISFANSIAQLADKAGADVTEVMDAVGADPRIGRAFLNAGRGYGGGCFPKDVSGLITSGQAHGVDLEIMRAAQTVNDSMPGYILEKAQEAIGSFEGKTVTVLGLSFKAGTSDTRRAPGITFANMLAGMRANVRAYDPQANEEAKPDLHVSVQLCTGLDEAIANADMLIVATEWPEFVQHDPQEYAAKAPNAIFVDAQNCCGPQAVTKAGLHYIGVGRHA